jgi:hypothetical protein
MPGLVIEQSITALLDQYRNHPLRLLREIGIQTRLAALIQSRLEDPYCCARIVNGSRLIGGTKDTGRLHLFVMTPWMVPENLVHAQ